MPRIGLRFTVLAKNCRRIEDFQFYLRVIEEGKLSAFPGIPQTIEKTLAPDSAGEGLAKEGFLPILSGRLPVLRIGKRLVSNLPRRVKPEKLGTAAGSAFKNRATGQANASAILKGRLSSIRAGKNNGRRLFSILLLLGKLPAAQPQKGNGKRSSQPPRIGLGRKRRHRCASFAGA